MIKTLLSAGALALASFTTPVYAQASLYCDTYEKVETLLVEQFSEVPVWQGVHTTGQLLIELWTNEETKTWSILGISPDGYTCILSDGNAYINHPLVGEEM